LSKFLANKFSGSLLLEEFSENKFLKAFYEKGAFAIHAEIQFLLDRSKQLTEFFELNHQFIISDYFPGKSLIFSEMNLNAVEFQMVKSLHQHLFVDVPKPELLIFLDRSIESLYQNIKLRNRPYEQNMDLEYLKKVHNSYETWLAKLDLPIVRIDADSIDLQSPQLLVEKFDQLFQLDFPKMQRKVRLVNT